MTRIVLFLATNLAVVVLLGTLLTGLEAAGVLPPGLVQARGWVLGIAAMLGMGGAFVSLLLSKQTALWSTGARIIETPFSPDEAWLLETVHRLARQAGIGQPELAVYDAREPNAFATGWSRDRGLVAVSTGLLRRMNRGEIAAVLAHEISHIANGDMVTLALLQGVLNTLVIIGARLVGGVVDRVLFRDERGYGLGYWMATLVAELCLGIFATALVMWFSRWREYRADAGASRLVGAQPMVSALARLGEFVAPSRLPAGLRAFGIRESTGLAQLFSSHPPIERRIERLLEQRGT